MTYNKHFKRNIAQNFESFESQKFVNKTYNFDENIITKTQINRFIWIECWPPLPVEQK
jgi:hypothetical protein